MNPKEAAPGADALSVEQAIATAQEALEELGSLWVRGEVFEYRGPYRGSGHFYFKLRDQEAQLDVKLWSGVARRALRCELEEGRQVLAHGRFDIWAKRGSLSFILDRIEDDGAGDLARRFELLKQRLRAEGCFDEARKRALPARPRTVVLITAHPSAASADVLRTLEEGAAPLRVWLRPTRVQGAAAVPDLVEALAEAGRVRPDLVLLSRGGGSLEDLWAFNEEDVVRAVVACPVPVLCAVGHETDFTLCDFAADARAKTPTAGAASLVAGWNDWRRRVAVVGEDLVSVMQRRLAQERGQLGLQQLKLREQRPARRLERLGHRLRQLHTDLVAAAEANLERRRLGLERSSRALAGASPGRRTALLRQRLDGLQGRLDAGSPTALLQRGYALVEVSGRPGFLRRAADVEVGQSISVRLASGGVEARVEALREPAESGGPEAPKRRE